MGLEVGGALAERGVDRIKHLGQLVHLALRLRDHHRRPRELGLCLAERFIRLLKKRDQFGVLTIGRRQPLGDGGDFVERLAKVGAPRTNLIGEVLDLGVAGSERSGQLFPLGRSSAQVLGFLCQCCVHSAKHTLRGLQFPLRRLQGQCRGGLHRLRLGELPGHVFEL